MTKVEIKDDKILADEDAEEIFQLGGYGRFEGGRLELKGFEAMNLMNRGKISVFEGEKELEKEEFYRRASVMDEDFPEKLLVYEDLRKRGFVVRPSYSFPCNLRVYKRGTSFEDDDDKLKHVKWLLDVVKTNTKFSISDETRKLRDAKNIRANLALGIVDEEGDVTYYELDEEGKLNSAEKMELQIEGGGEGSLEKDTVIVWNDIDKIHEPMYFGKRREERLELNLLEAVFLMKKDGLKVRENGDYVGVDYLVELAREIDPEFDEKYEIYRDLRDKGFLVRSGFKFGTHFRVYDRGVELKRGAKSPSEHTKWVVHAVPRGFSWSYPELSRFVRLALNIRSKPTLGIVNKDKKYYRIRRIKP